MNFSSALQPKYSLISYRGMIRSFSILELIFCAGLISNSIYGQVQSFHFRHLGVDEGLISPSTESVVQDSLGFIWISSESGLSRFDGNSFNHYYSSVRDSTSLLNKSASNMFVDQEGNLWVTMRQGGLSRYLPEADTFRNYAFSGEKEIGSVYFFCNDRNGDLIIRTVDFHSFRYNRSEDIFEEYSTWQSFSTEASQTPYPVYFDLEYGMLLVFAEGGSRYVKAIDDQTDSVEFTVKVNALVNKVFKDPYGIFWIGTWGEGLTRYDPTNGSVIRFLPKEDSGSLPGFVVEDIEMDSQGNLWLGTGRGLAVIDAETLESKNTSIEFHRTKNLATGLLINDHIKEIECDRAGRMWFATNGNGVYSYDPFSIKYSTVLKRLGAQEGEVIPAIYEYEDDAGFQWYPDGANVLKVNPNSNAQETIKLKFNKSSDGATIPIISIDRAADNRVCVSFQGGNSVLIDPSNLDQEYVDRQDKKAPHGITNTFRDTRGALWVSTYLGLLRHPGTEVSVFDTIVPDFDGRMILEDKDGFIWVGSWNEGLVRVNAETLEYERFLPNNRNQSGLFGGDAGMLQLSREGRVYTMTSKGLHYFDAAKGMFELVAPSADYNLHLTDYFAVDHEGNIWFSSLRGIYYWRRKERKVMFLDGEFGLPQTEYREIKVAKGGDVYINSGMGCLRINPAIIPSPSVPKAIRYTTLKYENANGKFKKSLLLGERVNLDYRDDFIEIDFAPLNYNLSGIVEYEYMLDGGSGVWADLGRENKITFLDIPPGDYLLKIRGRNDWGEYGPIAEIPFRVSPPWWLSTWAIVAYIIFLLISIVLYNRWRTHRLRVRQKKLELIVEERTEEISQERDRSESLLLNILPSEIAEELKYKGQAEAKKLDHVTVLFTDFKGFTKYSEQVSPEALVEDLHESFTAFDEIMAKHGVEKIKTIGDAYMAAGGVPTPNKTHAADVMAAAFEIRDFIEAGKSKKIKNGLPYFEIRIGIHTGPVVAGIVGVKKFSYDIWGDTVNTASRMESSGKEGKVNISDVTYELIRNSTDYNFEFRGKIQAKGKGEIKMYFAERK